MAVFTISDNSIEREKRKRVFRGIITVVISLVIVLTAYFFLLVGHMNDLKTYILMTIFFIASVSMVVFFSLRSVLKSITKEMKSIRYTTENERIIIEKNNIEQINIAKNEIQNIKKYKNNKIVITLVTNNKIAVNNHLENYDQLIAELNLLSPVIEVNSNPP